MDVTMKMCMLSAGLLVVLVIPNVFAGSLSKIKLYDDGPVRISSEGNEKVALNGGHHVNRRFIHDLVVAGTAHGYHNYLPYPPSGHGTYPSGHSPPFGTNFHHYPGHHPGGFNNHNNGPYGHHHHHYHHYDGNHHHFHHGHNYPHDHNRCKYDSSSGSQSSEDVETVTKSPYPDKTKPDRFTTETVLSSTKPTDSLTTTETFDIDVRLGENGK